MEDEVLKERAFVKDKIFDCLKMIGAASGSGFLASLVAIHTSGDKVSWLLKGIGSLLGGSVLLFCFAVACFLRWIVEVQHVRSDARTRVQSIGEARARIEFDKDVRWAGVWFTRLQWCAWLSLLIVVVCVVLAICAIWLVG